MNNLVNPDLQQLHCQYFLLHYLGSLLVAFGPHAKQSPRQEVTDFQFRVNLREGISSTQYLNMKQKENKYISQTMDK